MRQRLVKQPDGSYAWSDKRTCPIDKRAVPKPVEGEALGCIQSQVETMRAEAKLAGFSDIEFVPDRDVEGFYNCHAPNQERFHKYAEHCGMVDKNGQFSGKSITPQELEAAERLVKERYGQKDSPA